MTGMTGAWPWNDSSDRAAATGRSPAAPAIDMVLAIDMLPAGAAAGVVPACAVVETSTSAAHPATAVTSQRTVLRDRGMNGCPLSRPSLARGTGPDAMARAQYLSTVVDRGVCRGW